MGKIDYKKIVLSDFPKLLRVDDYQEICDLIIASFSNNKDVLSVYLAGNIGSPGISDLDIIVVYRDDRCGENIKLPWQISDQAKYVFIHRYENFNQSSFPWFAYLVPRLSEIKLLSGQKLDWHRPEKELGQLDFQWFQTGLIFDLLINKFLPIFRYQDEARINVRELLLVISSLRYTLKMVENLNDNYSMESKNFSEKMTDLRNNWFANDKNTNLDSLFSLLDDAQHLTLAIVRDLDQFIKVKLPDFAQMVKNNNFYLVNPKFKLAFVSDWDEKIFFSNFENGLIKFKLPFYRRRLDLDSYSLTLPNALFYFMLVYSQESGPFSHWLKKLIRKKDAYLLAKINVDEGLKKHIYAINKQVQEGIKSRVGESFKLWFSYGLYPYRRSIKRKLIDLLILFLRNFK